MAIGAFVVAIMAIASRGPAPVAEPPVRSLPQLTPDYFREFRTAVMSAYPGDWLGDTRHGREWNRSREEVLRQFVRTFEVVQRDPSLAAEAHYLRAQVLMWVEGEAATVEANVTSALDLEPHHSLASEARVLRAWAREELGDLAGALADWTDCVGPVTSGAAPWLVENRAILRELTGDLPGALQDLRSLADRAPEIGAALSLDPSYVSRMRVGCLPRGRPPRHARRVRPPGRDGPAGQRRVRYLDRRADPVRPRRAPRLAQPVTGGAPRNPQRGTAAQAYCYLGLAAERRGDLGAARADYQAARSRRFVTLVEYRWARARLRQLAQ